MKQEDFFLLLDKHLEGSTTNAEKQQLINFVSSFQEAEWNEMLLGDPLLLKSKIFDNVMKASEKSDLKDNNPAPIHRIHLLKTAWFHYAAAIILFIGLGAVAYLWNTQKEGLNSEKIISKRDVLAPQTNHATLTLSNGQKINLDGVKNGFLALQSGTRIDRTIEGDLMYNATATNDALEYNELRVPRGSQVASIILADGSKVYLNAGSSIRYPVAFNGIDRKVEIDGEAYFEIAKDAKRKFIVIGRKVQTEVLGTEFNVNTYVDEPSAKITLVQGAVRVSSQNDRVIIKPGQQVEIPNDQQLKINNNINVAQLVSWKKGVFVLNKIDLHSMLRQVSRWYDVEVEYKSEVQLESFSGTLSRRSPLSEVVKILQHNGIDCVIQDKKIIIGK